MATDGTIISAGEEETSFAVEDPPVTTAPVVPRVVVVVVAPVLEVEVLTPVLEVEVLTPELEVIPVVVMLAEKVMLHP